MDWTKVLGDINGPYEFDLGIGPGAEYEVPPPYPNLHVDLSECLHVRRTLVHVVDVTASAEERDRVEHIRIIRVVAETEDGSQIEFKRFAVPAQEENDQPVDTSLCHACGGTIPEGQHVIIEGKAYHKRCVEEGESDASNALELLGGGSGAPVHDGAGGSLGERAQGQREEEAPQEGAGCGVADAEDESPTTVSRVRYENGKASHAVTVVVLRPDAFLVTLWARQYGVAGASIGMWEELYPARLNLPLPHHVNYIRSKFFPDGTPFSRRDLRRWNELYINSLKELEGEEDNGNEG